MSNWGLLLRLNKAYSAGQAELKRLILDADFKDNTLAQELAVDLLSLRDDDLVENLEAVMKVTRFDIDRLPYKTANKLAYLRFKTKRIGDENGL